MISNFMSSIGPRQATTLLMSGPWNWIQNTYTIIAFSFIYWLGGAWWVEQYDNLLCWRGCQVVHNDTLMIRSQLEYHAHYEFFLPSSPCHSGQKEAKKSQRSEEGAKRYRKRFVRRRWFYRAKIMKMSLPKNSDPIKWDQDARIQ